MLYANALKIVREQPGPSSDKQITQTGKPRNHSVIPAGENQMLNLKILESQPHFDIIEIENMMEKGPKRVPVTHFRAGVEYPVTKLLSSLAPGELT